MRPLPAPHCGPTPGDPKPAVRPRTPSEVAGQRYLAYAAMSVVGQPDLDLAASRSGSWNGPWTRLGCILDHARVPCHIQVGTEDYEWGPEGPQLPELPGGGVLLTAVCFLPGRPAGQRQRLLMAAAEEAIGPYVVLGARIEPSGPEGAGENGHATTAVLGHDGLATSPTWSGRATGCRGGSCGPPHAPRPSPPPSSTPSRPRRPR